MNKTANSQAPTTDKSIISKELKLRIISAIVLAIIVLTITWIGGLTFTLFWAVVAILILWEFNRICSSKISFAQNIVSYISLLLIISPWIIGDYNIALIIFCVGIIVLGLWGYISNRSIWIACSLAYAALPFFAMSEMRSNSYNGLVVILLLYFCVWGADIFAYFSGRTIGGPKLAPRISPNKTWSGFIGSLVGAFFFTYIVSFSAGFEPIPIFFVIMLLIAIVSQVGDLLESGIKRRFKVKDSGALIPGHGGVLDRVDGLIVAAVSMWLISYVLVFNLQDSSDLPTVFINAFFMS